MTYAESRHAHAALGHCDGKSGHATLKERSSICLLDEIAGVGGGDWAAMMRILLQVYARALQMHQHLISQH